VEDGCAHGVFNGARIAVGGQDDDRNRAVLGDLVGGLGTGHGRHANVEEDEVGLRLPGELDRLASVAGGADDLVPERLELAGEGEVVQRLVVGDQDTERIAHGWDSCKVRGTNVSEARKKSALRPGREEAERRVVAVCGITELVRGKSEAAAGRRQGAERGLHGLPLAPIVPRIELPPALPDR
jgi:hypothetical protein